jgi:hypothetical protein
MSGSGPNLNWRQLALFVGVALAVAAVAILAGILFSDKRPDLAFEAGKAGLQLGVVTVFGAGVALGLRQFDVARDERARLREYRLSVFRDTVDAYHKVKTVRRTLRALDLVPPASGSVSSKQADEFHAQMCALNEAELSLEKIRREIEGQEEAFPTASKQLSGLSAMERYLRDILRVWETPGGRTGGDTDPPTEDLLKALRDFASRRRDTPQNAFWPSFKALERAIRADLVGPLS